MTALQEISHDLPDDDTGLVTAHLAGVDGAFDELFRRYHPRLVAFLTHRVRDAAAAEDLAQETLIRALHAMDRFDPSRPLWPWLRRIASNAAIDMARARSRTDALTAALASHPAELTADVPDLGEIEMLERAMAAVPERQRAALQKCYVEGWRPVDVADQFGVGSNAFEQLLHRARRNLRKAYARHDAPGQAAGLAWLLLLVRPVVSVADRVRRTASAVPHLAEVAVASVTVTTVLAVAPAPAPRTAVEAPLERAPVIQTQPVEADAPSAVDAVVDDRVEDVAPSAGSGVGAPVLPGGAGRPAPAAVSAAAPSGPTGGPMGPEGPGDGQGLLPPPDQGIAAPPGAGPDGPDSAAEAVGGCGSVVRSVVCATVGLVAQ